LPLWELDEEKGARNGVFVPEFPGGRGKQQDRGHKRKGRGTMRELKIVETSGRAKTPLVVKGSLPRVFLGLGVFMEAGLLFCGSYLLADAILQPLDAGTFSVVGGGLFLGLATVLLFYLAWPGKRGSISHREKPVLQQAEVASAKYEPAVQTRLQPNWVADKKEGVLRPM
jgi:hypothetical protein